MGSFLVGGGVVEDAFESMDLGWRVLLRESWSNLEE